MDLVLRACRIAGWTTTNERKVLRMWGHLDSFSSHGPNLPKETDFKRRSAFRASLKKIRRIYMKDPVAVAVLGQFAELSGSCTSIDVDTLVSRIPNFDNGRQRVIQFLRQLEEENWGTFITGRRGHKSRFEAPRGLRDVSQHLGSPRPAEHDASRHTDQPNEVESPQDGVGKEATVGETSRRDLTHQFMLRPNYPLAITLPVDLTGAEASRLSDFIKSLPFH